MLSPTARFAFSTEGQWNNDSGACPADCPPLCTYSVCAAPWRECA